jgi:hypothetical protein
MTAMQIIERAPDDRPLVVSPLPRYYTRQLLPKVALCALVALFALVAAPSAAVIGAAPGWWIGLGAVGLVTLGLAVISVRGWRTALARGPVCAADATGLWLRLDGGGLGRPRIAYLTWPEITRIRIQIWKSAHGDGVPFLCVDAPSAEAAATADPAIARATRRAIHVFGTPFVISDRRVDTDLGTMLQALRDLSGPEIVHAEGPWLFS